MRALEGRRVVVTRRPGQASRLGALLREQGAAVIEVPAIEIVPPRDGAALDGALQDLARYRWIVFTSANAVQAVRARCSDLGLAGPLGARSGPRLASVGAATTAALRAAFPGDEAVLEPADGRGGAALAEALVREGVGGARVLFPCSSRAREELPAALRAAGATVDAVPAYETIEPPSLRGRVHACLDEDPDLIAFASPSAVEAFASAAGERLRGRAAVAIGETTAVAARLAGLDVRRVALAPTIDGLVAAIVSALARASP